ncbi:hypothetical protein [uncultured Clostridium sp.]|mgnify:CR=1 FL=1|uniref:hypothetical protein n=1 Tax=uncultured Clostridium sp. TaxID=59620 RepID=UPI00262B213F|nr:hypothetical protein [uncultured Clostridium sp.]
MAKKQIITITDLVVQNPTLKASLSKFENVKQQLDERAKLCLLIKVTDESSLNVCENNMAKMNDLIKEVESVHKEVKKPYWDNCTAIDAAKNYVLDFIINPVDYLKSEKVNYINKIEAEAKRKADLEMKFLSFKDTIKMCLENVDTIKSCEDYIDKLNRPVNPEYWQELMLQAISLHDNYIILFALKKQELMAIETASPDEIEAIKQVAEEAKANIQDVVVESTPIVEIKKVRRTWKFEVSNLADVPREFLMVDYSKIKEWMKERESRLVDGEVVKGIKFFKEITTTV